MSELPNAKMTVDEFLTWAETQPGRHELVDGRPYSMAPERVRHTGTKFSISLALFQAIRKAELACEMLPDGATVRIDRFTAYEPDALVRCDKPLPGDTVEIPDAVIVVEVLSPGTRHVDAGGKFTGYFAVPSIQHYLMVDPDSRVVVHHRRDGDEIRSRIAGHGMLRLDPPGLDVEVLAMLGPE